MARPEKTSAVAEIVARFEDADAALLTEYRGLRVAEMAELRNALREAGADYKVLKNTLARIAIKDSGYEDLTEMLTGPTAVVFVKGDVVEAAKALDDAVKKFPVLVVKGGALRGGKLIDAEEAKKLAKLESRDVLLTKIAIMLNQPATQTVNVFAALLRDLGSMLAQVVEKKQSGELPSPEAPDDGTPGGREDAESGDSDAESGELPGGSGEPEAPAAAAEAEAPAAEAEAETPDGEDVGVPSPEGDDAEAQAESSEEPAAVPEATADEDGSDEDSEDSDDSDDSSSDDSSSDDADEEEK